MGRALIASTIAIASLAAHDGQPAAVSRGLKIVRAYDAWRHHDPRQPVKTAAAIAAADAECGSASGPFELLRLDTPAAAAAEIARQIDDAGIPRVIERAHARASSQLPGPPVTICVYAAQLSRGLPYLGGVGGIALGGGRIKLFLHPTKERFAKVPYTVAHEYHHEVLRSTLPWATVEDVLVREGKADHFAVGLYPALRPPHTAALSAAELAKVWTAFEAYRRGEGANFQSDFLIARNGALPIWAGYRLAFQMVGQYLASVRKEPREWLTTPSREIVAAFERSTIQPSQRRR